MSDPARTASTAVRASRDSVDRLIERARYTGPTVSADQLVGVDACLRQLSGQLALIARPELAERFGLEPSGTLFIGPPGTGKTLLARHLAAHLDVPLYQFAADEFGSEPTTIRAVFRRLAGERALLYIDEISILAQKREESSPDPNARRLLVALLTSLDGLATSSSDRRLWVIGACTPDIDLDPAIHRSGRLGVVVEFARPSEDQRRQLFELYLKGVPHSVSPMELGRLAEISNHATGADIHDWISQAASEALAEADVADPVIEYRHLETVVSRRGFVAAERTGREPQRATAIHEAAHAVVAYTLFGREGLAKVQIGFGQRPEELGDFSDGHFELSDDWLERNPPTSANWTDHAAVALAGVCAEQVILGGRRAGSASDVSGATALILSQLEQGDTAFGPSRRTIEEAAHRYGGVVGSEVMRSTVWHLVSRRFDGCWRATSTLIEDHREQIERLAGVLLAQKQTLTGDDIVSEITDVKAVA